VCAVVAPHIDFARGGRIYGLAYRPLLDEPPPDLYVVLGTDHNGDGTRYSLTRKSFDTPLGPVVTDGDAVEAVVRRAGPTLLRGELNHRREHSIEFQAVALRYLADRRGGGPPPAILPILCGSFHELVERGADPAADACIADLCGAVAEAVAGRRVVWIAAADLAHVGPHFGDPRPLGPRDLREILGVLRRGRSRNYGRGVVVVLSWPVRRSSARLGLEIRRALAASGPTEPTPLVRPLSPRAVARWRGP